LHGSELGGNARLGAGFYAVLALLALTSAGQTLSPGEVRISSGPYQPQPHVLRAQSRVVRVGVVVRNAKGNVVSGLKRADFRIYDDGKEQAISEFSVSTRQLRLPSAGTVAAPAVMQPNFREQAQPRPRYVALYFDDLSTKFGDMRHVQLAAENFIRHGVSPGDKIALFTASGLGNVDFTPDATELLGAIENLRFRGRAIDGSGCPHITPYDAYLISTGPNLPDAAGTVYPQAGSPTFQAILGEAVQCNCFSANPNCAVEQAHIILSESNQIWNSVREMSQDTLGTLQAAVDYLAKRPGERVLVLASSGFLTGTLETQVNLLVDDALRAGIVINALDAKGLYTEFPGQAQMNAEHPDLSDQMALHEAESFGSAMASATAVMAELATGTGGRFFHNRNDLIEGYYQLAAAPQIEYLLGFAPEDEKLNGSFHKLKVEVSMPRKLYVEARPGYFAPPKETKEASEPTPDERIDAEVRGNEDRSDFPAKISETPSATKSAVREISVQAHLDIQKLPFEKQHDRHVEELTFVLALFDAQGRLVTGKEARMRLALKPNSFERFSKSGINIRMSLKAPPDNYRLRVVVEEAVKGEMITATQNVQIP
jgi:VWFA-related protein